MLPLFGVGVQAKNHTNFVQSHCADEESDCWFSVSVQAKSQRNFV